MSMTEHDVIRRRLPSCAGLLATSAGERRRKRLKTFFPLSSAEVKVLRVRIAWMLSLQGLSVRAIRQVLNLDSPEAARKLVARGRVNAEKKNPNANIQAPENFQHPISQR